MIFYKQTKAYHDSGNDIVWTYLTWPNHTNTPGDASVADSFMPSLSWSQGDTPSTNTKDLGKILTHKVNTTIVGKWEFGQSVEVGAVLSTSDDVRSRQSILLYPDTATLEDVKASISTKDVSFYQVVNASGTFKIGYRTADKTKSPSACLELNAAATTPALWIGANCTIGTTNAHRSLDVHGVIWSDSLTGTSITGSNLIVTGGASITGTVSVGANLSIGGEITAVDAIACSGKCQASYFNATSDRRAKENIQLASYSALELIKKVQVYNYNYKIDSERVTGIMAQDLLEAQPKELDLVSNTQATGDNGDYMSIKTDKLVSVLWKAIQEQQEQIEELKKELNTLRGGN